MKTLITLSFVFALSISSAFAGQTSTDCIAGSDAERGSVQEVFEGNDNKSSAPTGQEGKADG